MSSGILTLGKNIWTNVKCVWTYRCVCPNKQTVFKWRNGSHSGVPDQRNDRHIGALHLAYPPWFELYLRMSTTYFISVNQIKMADGHVNENDLKFNHRVHFFIVAVHLKCFIPNFPLLMLCLYIEKRNKHLFPNNKLSLPRDTESRLTPQSLN